MKKRFLCMLLALLLCAALLPAGMQAATAEETSGQCGDNLYWSFDASSGTLTVTGSGAMWDYLEDDLQFTPWRDFQIKKVSLPNGLTRIGAEAFLGCTDLMDITIPNSVTSIGWCAFYLCESLKSITIPNKVTQIGNHAFYSCTGFSSVTIPDSVTELGDCVFFRCSNLKTVKLGKGIRQIGWYAFDETSLTDVWYAGTSAQRANIEIDADNETLLNTTWHYLPEITTQPNAQTVAVGNSVTLSVAAAGAELTYQWQYSTDNGASWTNWSGKTKRSVTFNGSETNNGNFYRCKVTNKAGSVTSKWARLNVSGVKPRIVEQPKAQTAAAGKDVTFKVVVGGTGKAYQWQYSKDNGASWTNWSGKTSASVTVTASATNNGCLYRCVIKNSKGTVWSKPARLTVSGVKPMILTQPESQSAQIDKTVTFKVTAGGVGKTYQWQWSKDGKTWSNCSSTGYNTATFSFTASATFNGRSYRCVVKNSIGSVTSKAAKVTIVGLPSITTQPSAQKGAVGTPVTFKVVASGANLTYQWQYSKDGGKTWVNCSSTGSDKASFTFKTNAGLDGRLYRCVVKNSVGSVNSNAAKLTVPEYFAILAGEENYYDTRNYLPGPLHDICAMEGMLKGLRAKYTVRSLPDATKSQALNAISAYVKNSESYDILVFYYSGHGTRSSYSSESHGSLCMVDGTYITMKELASALSQFKGKVVVLLDSCYSGAAIEKTDGSNELDAFNASVIEAFSDYTIDVEPEGETIPRMGELKQSKFTVLTAASYTQTSASVGYSDGYYFGLFTYYLLDTVGCGYPNGAYTGSMPGDADGNSRITLGEAYDWIVAGIGNGGQSTQYYGNLSEVLFRR